MKRKMMIAAAFLCVVFCSVTQIRYGEPMAVLFQNRDVFETSVSELRKILDGLETPGDDVPHERGGSLKIDCSLRGDRITVTAYRFQKDSEPGHNPDLTPAYGYNEVELPTKLALSESSVLYESLIQLKGLGVGRVEVHRFTDDGPYAGPPLCEVWYGLAGGKRIVYAQSGRITPDYDLMESGGYGLHQKRVSERWFVGSSYYDGSSDFWRG